jgi:hypothetical protein
MSLTVSVRDVSDDDCGRSGDGNDYFIDGDDSCCDSCNDGSCGGTCGGCGEDPYFGIQQLIMHL